MSGNLSSSHTDIPVSGTVAPGGTYSFSIAMRTPAAQTSAATYKEEWKFINGSGATLAPLGSLWAQIVVPAASEDHGNNISTATAVSINTGRSGVINYGGDYDYFRIVVPSSGTLTVYTTGSTDTYGYLKNSSGSDLASNDDSSGSVNFRISQSVAAGTYYVAVRHYYSSTGTGSYTFYNTFTAAQTDDHGNSISTATAVSVNTSRAGVINSAGDYDYFRVSVPSNGTLTVYTTGSTDTYGHLKNSSGSDLASNDDSGSANFRISVNVTAGTYYVAVRHYSSTGTGAYTLYVGFVTSSPSNPFAAATDAFVNANIGRCIDMDGAYGYQCVDLMHAFIQNVLGVPRAYHSIRGNAYQIYANIGSSVTISYGSRTVRLDKIANTPTGVPQKGDIIFWNTSVGGGYGHVAIFISGDVNSFSSLDQNWPVGSCVQKINHTYSNVAGWLRPVLLSN